MIQPNDEKIEEVPDRFNLVYIFLLIIGGGVLYPYNALITAADYYDIIFPHDNVESYLPLFLM